MESIRELANEYYDSQYKNGYHVGFRGGEYTGETWIGWYGWNAGRERRLEISGEI